jgi:multidrug resistance efflux pump
MLVAALLWGVFGSVPILLHADGILIREGSVRTVDAPVAGAIQAVDVRAGDAVEAGQAVAQIAESERGRTTSVTSPYTGRVLEVRQAAGNRVTLGAGLLTVERPDGDLEAVLYLPPARATGLQPGMEARISPGAGHRQERGLLPGRVRSVGSFPSSRAAMRQLLGSDELVDMFSTAGPPIEVRVSLTASDVTGGPANGTLCSVDVVTAQEAPISLVLGLGGR